MKKLLSLILIISMLILTLPACSFFQAEVMMISIKTPNIFENERFLLIEDYLIDKNKNKTCKLTYDESKASSYYSSFTITYKVEFEEHVFKTHVFLYDSTYYYYYNYIITFNYLGEEVSRVCPDNTSYDKEEAEYACSLRASDTNNLDSFQFRTFRSNGEIHLRNLTDTNREIGEFANLRYLTQNDGDESEIHIVSNLVGDTIWFSTTVTNKIYRHYLTYVMNGIYKSEIFTYNTTTKEFKQICDYSIKKRQIIDLDTKGFYTMDIDGNLKYFDYATKKETLIHEFPYDSYTFYITDNYIFATLYDDYYFYTKSN